MGGTVPGLSNGNDAMTETHHPGTPKRTRVLWTEAEIQIVRDHWPSGGMRVVAAMLPSRTQDTIKQMAHKNGIKRTFKR